MKNILNTNITVFLYIIFVDVDECLTSPCSNNGACINLNGSFNCTCIPGWSGDHCQTGNPYLPIGQVKQLELPYLIKCQFLTKNEIIYLFLVIEGFFDLTYDHIFAVFISLFTFNKFKYYIPGMNFLLFCSKIVIES